MDRFGNYRLVRAVPCGPGDACYVAMMTGVVGFERYSFLRILDQPDVDDATIERLKTHAKVTHPGAAQIYDLFRQDGRIAIAQELIDGRHLEGVVEDLAARGHRIALPTALSMLMRIRDTLASMPHHGHLTARRIRLERGGRIALCVSADEPTGHDLCDAARLMLSPALEDPTTLDFLRNDDAALAVAADRLMELRPDLDRVIHAVLRESPSVEDVFEMLTPHFGEMNLETVWSATSATPKPAGG